MLVMRYQYISTNGLKWTKWFKIKNTTDRPKWQLKNKLLNEYREINTEDELNDLEPDTLLRRFFELEKQ